MPAENLMHALEQNNFVLPKTMIEKLQQYLALLQRWNQVFNLTAIRDMDDMIWLHILDSLSISNYIVGPRVIDVGSGAGLPGIPLALTQEDKFFVLLDSNQKKTRFLTQVVLELEIKNITVINSRCEDYQPEDLFDCVISRAFSDIATLLMRTTHLLKKDGLILAMKGVYPESEIKAIPDDFKLVAVHKLNIKGLAAERHVVCFQRN